MTCDDQGLPQTLTISYDEGQGDGVETFAAQYSARSGTVGWGMDSFSHSPPEVTVTTCIEMLNMSTAAASIEAALSPYADASYLPSACESPS